MFSSLRWLAASAFAVLIVVSPGLAVAAPANSASNTHLAVTAPGAPDLPALQPASTAAPSAALELRPVQMASVPFNTLSTATLLPAETPAVGYRLSGQRASGIDQHLQWTIAGACIGAIVGLVDRDVVSMAAIGAGLGFGLSYVVAR
jgi:hypothetical protein